MIPEFKDLLYLLGRTNLSLSFNEFLKVVAKTYNFEKIASFEPISVGYEDANIKISTEKGKFVLKIFAKEKTGDQINNYVNVLLEAKKKNLPFTRLFEGSQGYLSHFAENNSTVYYFLTEFFNGKNFETSIPTLSEMKEIAHILAKFNSIDFPITDTYDSWGSKNLVEEFEKHETNISQDLKEILLPIVEKMRKLDTSGYSVSIIHADLQRKHVLKNDAGKYCILDLGCLRRDAKVFDLSIYLAWFCLAEDTWNKKEEIYKEVLDAYTQVNPLSRQELASIPILIKASYAAYLLKTSVLIQEGDISEETRQWHEKSKRMLTLSSEWN